MFTPLQILEDGLETVKASPKQNGRVEMIVCRPRTGERRKLQTAELDPETGLVGDNWSTRGFRPRKNGPAPTDTQLTLMNARAIALIAGDESRWSLAGDQFYVDLDLSRTNLPPGARLKLGTAVIEVSPEPHLGCRKFRERYGKDALMFVNSQPGRALNLRGINARIVKPGEVGVGGSISKMI